MMNPRVYNEIEIASEESGITRQARQTQDGKKCVIVKNGEKPIRNCRVVLDNLEFYFQGEWISSPNGFERKALKWGVGDECSKGAANIAANGSEVLEIVGLFRFPNPHFVISYFDGYTGKTYQLVGMYKLECRIEGGIMSGGNVVEIIPIVYEVQLNFADAHKLDIENVRCIPPGAKGNDLGE